MIYDDCHHDVTGQMQHNAIKIEWQRMYLMCKLISILFISKLMRMQIMYSLLAGGGLFNSTGKILSFSQFP